MDAAECLGRIGNHAAALKVMTRLLADGGPPVRARVAADIGWIFEAKGVPAIPALVKALDDEFIGVRPIAAEGLSRIGPLAKDAEPALIAVLADGDQEYVHSAAAEALGQIGPDAKEAVPVLLRRLKAPTAYVRVNAAKALWHIAKHPAALKVVLAGMNDRSGMTRVYAAETAWLIQQHTDAIPLLIEAAQDEKNNVRYAAARALGRLGPSAKAALPALRNLLDDSDWLLVETGQDSIKKIDRVAKVP